MRSALTTRSSFLATRAPAAVVTAEAAPATAAPAAAPASAAAKSASGGSRRALLASLAAAGALALSSPAPPPAAAAIGVWDGTSAASGSCAVGPDGDACRARTIAKDFGERAAGDGGGGYGESIKASSGLATNSNSIPIPSMQGPYVSETRALSASIREYLALAPSDASRVPKGKALRKAGAVWAAKYAPGGSARLKSARRCYISVDALQGHLAANGAAPYPASKASKLLAGLADVEELLSKGQ